MPRPVSFLDEGDFLFFHENGTCLGSGKNVEVDYPGEDDLSRRI